MSLLTVTNLHKRYGDIEAVRGVSFDIAEGEVFGLLGPNGAGKTTTISMLSTLIAPTGGQATLAGHHLTREVMQVRALIGVVPQELALYDDLTAHENLAFWGQMYGLTGKKLADRIAQVLAQIGLADRAHQRVKTYSGGMKRRVNIGVGLLHQPRLLFMDEPTVGIDPQSRRAILDTVKALNAQGMTVLYTTHYMEEAAELAHRVGIMDHGQLIALGTQAELTRQVGEHDTLRLHLTAETDPAPLAAALRALPGIHQVTPNEHTLTLITAQAAAVLAPVVAQASALGYKVRSVDIEEPNLETVFLSLTGRALRD